MANTYDLMVIGAGSGGLSAVQRATEYGKKCIIFENNKIGGTCVNVGCVPKKISWYVANACTNLKNIAPYYDQFKIGNLQWQKVKDTREKNIASIRNWYDDNLIKVNNIDYIPHKAKLIDKNTIVANGHYFKGKYIVLAVGSKSILPNIKGAEYGLNSDDFFALDKLAKKIAIVGSGYIAVELASLLNKLGTKVFLYHRFKNILRTMEPFITEKLTQSLANDGVVFKQTTIDTISQHNKQKIVFSSLGQEKFDEVIFAVGRKPLTTGLGLENIAIKTAENGSIITDKFEQSSVKNIYALGDVNGKLALTPVAIAAARCLMDRLFNKQKDRYLNYQNVPTVVFSHPPLGTIGLNYKQAKQKYKKVKCYTTSFIPMADTLWQEKTQSSFMLICAGDKQKIVGCHILDHNADEILQGFAVAINMGACKDDFDNTVAIHPTSAEELVTMR